MNEDLLDQLVEVVRAHYREPEAQPLLLSRIGQKHPGLLLALKEAFGSPRNYATDGHGPLVDAYRLFLQGALDVAAVEARVTRKRYPYELLPRFYAKNGGKNKSFAYDRRGLVFPRGAAHGAHHLVPEGDLSLPRLRRELEGRFRFGTPLEPPGFQHDVQWEKDALLVREHFACVDVGPVEVSADHANVFGNDVVKADKVTALKK